MILNLNSLEPKLRKIASKINKGICPLCGKKVGFSLIYKLEYTENYIKELMKYIGKKKFQWGMQEVFIKYHNCLYKFDYGKYNVYNEITKYILEKNK